MRNPQVTWCSEEDESKFHKAPLQKSGLTTRRSQAFSPPSDQGAGGGVELATEGHCGGRVRNPLCRRRSQFQMISFHVLLKC
ncbi:hypothetical protein PoB_004966800 [Plakobranchus ocellatus]|uniref:Uncharacterized protein n=1 Tax=Plakobranchus ocellatus TaxID=259542 RepID=A0AAV4BVC5_9GAST|nr:hypothetical protein PoB_004966800 [Plakobranchus ocellatus]